MFIFKENIEPNQHDEFVKNHPLMCTSSVLFMGKCQG